MKISIIIPIYNVEKYLARCLDSVINQTHMDLEIILVNDGSKDKSLNICKYYQKKDSRIILIDKINEGVSVARNTGIDAATGKYIAFVDADDWIEPHMYENMLNTIEKYKCNIAFCNYSKDRKNIRTYKRINVNKDVLEKRDIINELIANMIGWEDIFPKYNYIMGCIWRSVYNRDFINKFNLRFTPGISIMEDLVFNIQALIYCHKVCIDHGFYYHYMQNKTSSLHTYNEKMWLDQVEVHNMLEEILKDAELDEYLRNRLDSRYITMAACAVGNEVYRGNSKLKQRMKIAKYIINDDKLKEVLDRAKENNFKNLHYLRSKQEFLREKTVIKNLLFYISNKPSKPSEKEKQNKNKNEINKRVI
ncbi:MAG: glycosyltransferase [Sedimentibacter sp.]